MCVYFLSIADGNNTTPFTFYRTEKGKRLHSHVHYGEQCSDALHFLGLLSLVVNTWK